MTETPDRTEAVFAAAIVMETLEERTAYLDQACAGDPSLRERIEDLLRAHDRVVNVLDRLVPGSLEQTAAYAPGEQPGTVVGGRYKLLETVGEGGMGTVWVAEQTQPVRRKVALKFIKPGMDSKSVLARFEAERQALAVMDHPNIARVLDAGSTESGRPFFVMEVVKGIPITRYCDQHKLTPRQRLELFVPVCQAIQHAHQKGVIHRDIKPSNVLVAMFDDRPVPKVIDFGLAKATGQALTEKTYMTGFGALAGTPEYMSPEQASLNNVDVDTRSDVYSLGVLLYELLTGTTPVDRKSLGQAALLEVLRIVREVDAPRPSAKLSSSDALPSIAANRSIEPARLAKLMQGELDWVLLKALEKDRTRRYETASGLARDIQHYLSDEVVEARPPSIGYRLRKFVRRHKGQVLAVGVVLLALLAGITGTTFGLIRAEQQRQFAEQAKLDAEARRAEAERQQRRAEAGEKLADQRLIQVEAEKKKAEEEKQVAQTVRAFLQNKLLGQSDLRTQAYALLRAGRSSAEATLNPTIRELLDRAALELAPDKIEANFPKQPLLQAELLTTVGDTYRGVGEYDRAIACLTRAAELRKSHLGADHLKTLDTLIGLATAYQSAGEFPQAIDLFERVRDARAKTFGADHPTTLVTLDDLALAYQEAGKFPQAIDLFERVRGVEVRKLGADNPETLTTLNNLALAYQDSGKLPQAIKLLEQVRDASARKLGADHPDTLTTLNNLAGAYADDGKYPKAIEILEQVSDARRKKLAPDHPDTLATLSVLAGTYAAAGKLPEAIEMYKRVRDDEVSKLGADHPQTLNTLCGLAVAYLSAGNAPQAIELLEPLGDAYVKKLGANHPATLTALQDLAFAYRDAGRLPQAIDLFERLRGTEVRKLGVDHPQTLITLGGLAGAYAQAGRLPQAIALYEQVLDAEVKKWGADHPGMLATRNNLAVAYQAAGKLPQAIKLFERVHDAAAKNLGADHPDTLRALQNLAVAYQVAGKLLQAIKLYEQAYEGLKQNEKALPKEVRQERMRDAIQRLIDLATATNRPDDVKKWQTELAEYPAQRPADDPSRRPGRRE